MQRDQPIHPFINVRTQENRTPTGRRTSRPARRAALYYAYGSERDQGAQEAPLAGRLRGQWLGPDGRVQPHEAVMTWVQAQAMTHRYTFQAVLSVPSGVLTGAEFSQALRQGGQAEEWRLMAHEDTRHRHAHVLWFGDKRMNKQAFLSWQTAVRAELVRLEQQHPSAALSTGARDRTVPQEAALETDSAALDATSLRLSTGQGMEFG